MELHGNFPSWHGVAWRFHVGDEICILASRTAEMGILAKISTAIFN
jgi:hypothetical protein